MFWLARLIRLARPMPPTPTAATFRVSLGGGTPRPRTWLGTMAQAAPPAATLARNARREISFFLLMGIFPRRHYRALRESLGRQVLNSRDRGIRARLRDSWGTRKSSTVASRTPAARGKRAAQRFPGNASQCKPM